MPKMVSMIRQERSLVDILNFKMHLSLIYEDTRTHSRLLSLYIQKWRTFRKNPPIIRVVFVVLSFFFFLNNKTFKKFMIYI